MRSARRSRDHRRSLTAARGRAPGVPVGVWLLLALGATWCFWCATALLAGADGRLTEPRLGLPFLLGGLAPALLAFAALAGPDERGARRRLLRRLFTPIGLRWVHWAALLLPAAVAGSIMLVAWLSEAFPVPEIHGPGAGLLAPLVILLFGPLPEEIAWRGFALERLLGSVDGLRASLILAGVWMLWHLPLFLIPGTYQAELGLGTPAFALFMAMLVPNAIVLTALYCSTRGSVLAAVLMHASINLAGECVDLGLEAGLLQLALWSFAAVALLARYGPETLSDAPLARWRKAADRRPTAPRRRDAAPALLTRDPTIRP